VAAHAALLAHLDKNVDRAGIGGAPDELQRNPLGIAGSAGLPSNSNGAYAPREIDSSEICHHSLCKPCKLFECIRRINIEPPRKGYEVAQIHGFDRHGLRNLACELTLTCRIRAVTDDEHAGISAGYAGTSCGNPFCVIILSVQLDPRYASRSLPEINRLAP
jgi:hypothetical protein